MLSPGSPTVCAIGSRRINFIFLCGRIRGSLARYGLSVCVLEQHDVAGGGTHTFVVDGKRDYAFPSGLHYTIPQSAELLQLACGHRRPPVRFDKMGAADGCFDRVVLGRTGEDFRVKHGLAHFDDLRRLFPSQQGARVDWFWYCWVGARGLLVTAEPTYRSACEWISTCRGCARDAVIEES